MNTFLPYGRQSIEADDIAAVSDALQSDFLTTGPRVAEFEAALVDATGARHAVSCNSGTAALHIASIVLDLEPGDQVIVPSITFLATANAPRHVGAEIVFCDVDPQTGLMTGDTFQEALTRAPRAKAVFPVHLNGSLAPMVEIHALARQHGLTVIEDACHALGTDYHLTEPDKRNSPGRAGDCRLSDLACFSFHPVKAIAMGEGGAVTTNNDSLAQRLALVRSHGMTRDPAAMTNTDMAFAADGRAAPWYYEMHEPGFNYRVPDILCALGLSQLAKLDRFITRRRHLAALYDDALAPLAPLVRPVKRFANVQSAFHLYAVRIAFDDADTTRIDVIDALRANGIGTQVHYIPVHRQPYYSHQPGAVPLLGADAYYDQALSLPLFPAMADSDVARVADALTTALTRAGAPRPQPL